MSKPYLPRFAHPSALREIDQTRLIELVRPHANFLADHNIRLPDDPERLNYDALGVVLLQPLADTPYELVDALSHIHEMATPEGMESLLDEMEEIGLALPERDNYSPADVAAFVWLNNPNLLRRKHAHLTVQRRRSFDCYLPADAASHLYRDPDQSTLDRLQSDIAAWYAERHRGLGVQMLKFEHQHEVRVVVRHGGPYKREGCLNDGEPGSVHFRPMDFGFAVLDRRTWELRVNCRGKREKDLYRQKIGQHLFGQPDYFCDDAVKYTLEPIRSQGKRCLICKDVKGIGHVRLVELTVELGGSFNRMRVEKADDIFLALEHDQEVIPPLAVLRAAKFLFTFSDSSKPRPVSIINGNRAQYTRDHDADLVELFFRLRGFVQGGSHAAVACA